MTPTEELYSALQIAYDHFNEALFNRRLPQVLFTTQRQHGMMGYFSPDRWTSSKGSSCHEIAINPLYIGSATLIQLMQTLVHEMVHCWQHCFGTPSRKAYHNKEWSDKMASVGLIPTSTGRPGGRKVGQNMSDYPEQDGPFIKASIGLLSEKQFALPWVDRFSNNRHSQPQINLTGDDPLAQALAGIDERLVSQLTTGLSDLFGESLFADDDFRSNKKKKVKYTCSDCGINVWGKGELLLRCDDCDNPLREAY